MMIETEYRCVNCKKAVSEHTKMYSNGRCPLCGFKGEEADEYPSLYDVFEALGVTREEVEAQEA